MTRREWMDDSTKLFLTTVDGLGDEQFAAASSLSGWTRATSSPTCTSTPRR